MRSIRGGYGGGKRGEEGGVFLDQNRVSKFGAFSALKIANCIACGGDLRGHESARCAVQKLAEGGVGYPALPLAPGKHHNGAENAPVAPRVDDGGGHAEGAADFG